MLNVGGTGKGRKRYVIFLIYIWQALSPNTHGWARRRTGGIEGKSEEGEVDTDAAPGLLIYNLWCAAFSPQSALSIIGERSALSETSNKKTTRTKKKMNLMVCGLSLRRCCCSAHLSNPGYNRNTQLDIPFVGYLGAACLPTDSTRRALKISPKYTAKLGWQCLPGKIRKKRGGIRIISLLFLAAFSKAATTRWFACFLHAWLERARCW